MLCSHTMHFGDLDFDVRPVHTETGRIKWVETGMPRLHPDLHRLAVFLYGTDPSGAITSEPEGTGFLVSYPMVEREGTHAYLVSNYHVAITTGCARFAAFDENKRLRLFGIDREEWQFDPNGDDLSIIDITDYLNHADAANCIAIPISSIVTDKFVEDAELGIGDDVFMIGLLAGHAHGEPVGRFGNIAAVPNPNAPVEQGHKKKRPSFLVDMRSRGGHSGSPVTVYRVGSGDLSYLFFPEKPRALPIPGENYNQIVGLLGIHSAQFNEYGEVMKDARGDPVYDGDTLKMPSGMTIVVPGQRILDALEWPYFQNRRKAREAQMKKTPRESHTQPEAAPSTTPSADLAISEPPTTEGDEQHRERFMATLSSATKRRSRDG